MTPATLCTTHYYIAGNANNNITFGKKNVAALLLTSGKQTLQLIKNEQIWLSQHFTVIITAA